MALEPRVQFNLAKSSVIPVPDKQMFVMTLVFTILGFSDTEKTLTLTLKQKEDK